MTERQGESVGQRSSQRTYFEHTEMDYYFSWILGRQTFGGSEAGECFGVATRIANGDPESWHREWLAIAKRIEARAEEALLAGHRVSAREAYLRASTYYRAPLFIMGPKNPAFYDLWERSQRCFRTAAGLFDPPIQQILVPFEGKQLPGYLWKVDDSGESRPTLIVIGGIETWAEDAYFITGQSGARRGYNVLTVDLPGQGLNPDQGLRIRARAEVPMRAIVDYALSRPEVDGSRLALFGFSWGGNMVLRAAQHDQRIKALVANPPTYHLWRAARSQQRGHGKADPVGMDVFSQIRWRFGASSVMQRIGLAVEFFTSAKADCSKIPCPTLGMAGEGEAPDMIAQAHECYSQLPNQEKRLTILTKEDGGEAHCQVNNLSLLNQVIFDFLDEALA